MLLGMGAVPLRIWACGRPWGQPCVGGYALIAVTQSITVIWNNWP